MYFYIILIFRLLVKVFFLYQNLLLMYMRKAVRLPFGGTVL